MQPALSGNCFSLHKREVYSGPASLLPLRSSMLIKCTQLSIEVALAGILAQIYGGRPLNHMNADGWVPEFEKEHNSMLSINKLKWTNNRSIWFSLLCKLQKTQP